MLTYLPIFIELVVIVFIVVLYSIAARELTAKAIQRQSPAIAELKELREAIEQLTQSLEDRAAKAEARLATLIKEADNFTRSSAAQSYALSLKDSPEPVSPAIDTGVPQSPVPPPFETLSAIIDPHEEPAGSAIDDFPAAPDAEETSDSPAHPDGKPDPYNKVYALYDDGITDHKEIAKRSGLGLAEVLLVLSMRPRK